MIEIYIFKLSISDFLINKIKKAHIKFIHIIINIYYKNECYSFFHLFWIGRAWPQIMAEIALKASQISKNMEENISYMLFYWNNEIILKSS